MISTTLASLSAAGVFPGMSGSTPARSHPASNDAPATPAPDIFKNSLRVNVRLSLYSCVPLDCTDNHRASSARSLIVPGVSAGEASAGDVIQVKPVYNLGMTVFRYRREHFEEGEYVRRVEAKPGDGLDPIVRIVEDLGTVEIPCGKLDCRSNCLEYLVNATGKSNDYTLAECKISALVSII
jgi:hypothetical protein